MVKWRRLKTHLQRLTWRAWLPVGFALPRLRLYQQLLILLMVGVILPLGSASIIVYQLNQRALKKETTRFTQQLAQAVYQDLTTEMGWQQSHGEFLKKLMLQGHAGGNLSSAVVTQQAKTLFALDPELEAVALYDGQGKRVAQSYRHYESTSPELRLAAELPVLEGKAAQEPYYKVAYIANGDMAQQANYQLRASMPVQQGVSPGYRFVFQRRYDFLARLIRKHQASLADSAYLVDEHGVLIAGSVETLAQHVQLGAKDLAFFESLKPGVVSVFKTNVTGGWQLPQTLPSWAKPIKEGVVSPSGFERFLPELLTQFSWLLGKDDEETEAAEAVLDTVFVKIPAIDWGLIIESPYHVKQQFVKRARNQAIVVMVLCLLVVLGLGLFYLYGLMRNFRQLIKGIKAMAKGNYDRRLRLITNYATPHELVYLSREFNRMARTLQEGWQEIQHLNQQLSELDALKSNLLDTVSHELRTPLTNIKGYASRLLRYGQQLDEATQTHSLRVIKQQADRLSRLVEDLLTMPDLERHQLRLYSDKLLLAPCLDTCIQLARDKTKRPIRLTYEPLNSPVAYDELCVFADPDRLEQVLVNLLDNAIKYSLPLTETDSEAVSEEAVSETEAIVLVVRCVPSPKPQGAEETSPSLQHYVEISLSNPSAPIDEAVLPHLCDKFKRLDDGLTRTTRGSGLGLFITKNLLEAMSGSLALAYREERFTATLRLPFACDEQQAFKHP
jgi:signal transduction histidine kinase